MTQTILNESIGVYWLSKINRINHHTVDIDGFNIFFLQENISLLTADL